MRYSDTWIIILIALTITSCLPFRYNEPVTFTCSNDIPKIIIIPAPTPIKLPDLCEFQNEALRAELSNLQDLFYGFQCDCGE